MLFKTGRFYRLPDDFVIDFGQLETALAEKPARECASQEKDHLGFAPAYGKGDAAPLVHIFNGDCALVRVRKDERLLPDSVVSQFLAAKVEEISSTQDRRVRKKEKTQLKDEIIQSLLPQAFPLNTSSYLVIDKSSGLIWCNSTTPGTAEDMLSLIREVIGSLPVRPLRSKMPPSIAMTEWVKKGTAPTEFSILGDCMLKDTDETGGAIQVKKQDLADEALLKLLEGGKVVTNLRLAYSDNLSFTLDTDCVLKGISYGDVFEEKAKSDAGDDADGLFDANLCLMILTMREMLPKLMEAIGGEEFPKVAE